MEKTSDLIEIIDDVFLKALEEKMDPVGKEDDDIDNDGDSDSSDQYLKKRRAAIAKQKANMKEGIMSDIASKAKTAIDRARGIPPKPTEDELRAARVRAKTSAIFKQINRTMAMKDKARKAREAEQKDESSCGSKKSLKASKSY